MGHRYRKIPRLGTRVLLLEQKPMAIGLVLEHRDDEARIAWVCNRSKATGEGWYKVGEISHY